MSERRASYREQRDLEAIEVSLALPGRDYARVALIDLSSRGAAVAITGLAADEGYAPGTTVHLEFRLKDLEPVTEVRALIRNVRGSGASRIVGIEIIDWTTLHERLPPRLFAKFNRRRHYRVDIPRATPVEISMARATGGDTVRAELTNVSVSGCQLRCPAAVAPMLGEQVGLGFVLPDSSHPLALSGIVRTIAGAAEGVRCGIEFEGLDSREEQELAHYVMQRQRELVAVN